MSFATPWKAPLKTSASENSSQGASQPLGSKQVKTSAVKKPDYDEANKENRTLKSTKKKNASKRARVEMTENGIDVSKKVANPGMTIDDKISVVDEKSTRDEDTESKIPAVLQTESNHSEDVDMFADADVNEYLLKDSESDNDDQDVIENTLLDESSVAKPNPNKAKPRSRQKPLLKVTQMNDTNYDDLFDNNLKSGAQDDILDDSEGKDASGSAARDKEEINVKLPAPPKTPRPDQSASTPKSQEPSTSFYVQPSESAVTPVEPIGQQEPASGSSGPDVTPLNTFLAPKERKRIINAPEQKKPRSLLTGPAVNPRRIDFERVANEKTPYRAKATMPFVAPQAQKCGKAAKEKGHSKENAQRKIVFGQGKDDVPAEKSGQKRQAPATPTFAGDQDESTQGTETPSTSQQKAFIQPGSASKRLKKTHESQTQSSQASDVRHRMLSQTLSQSLVGFPLSQPSQHLSPRERLQWYQKRRDVGIWVFCDNESCNKVRYLKDTKDPVTLPDKWYCSMNPDKSMSRCSAPEVAPTLAEEDDMIHNKYTAGSLVWGRMDGYPWWPAMVDDCPDTEQYYWTNGFSDIPTHYNVVFFDEADVTRAWLTPAGMKTFTGQDTSRELKKVDACGVNYGKRIATAKQQALNALKLPLAERLRKFSFLARYKGIIDERRKKNELKYRKKGIQSSSKHTETYKSDSSDESESNDGRQKQLKLKKPIRLSKDVLKKLLLSKEKKSLKRKLSKRTPDSESSGSDGSDSESSGSDSESDRDDSEDDSDTDKENKENDDDEDPPGEVSGTGNDAVDHDGKENEGNDDEEDPPGDVTGTGDNAVDDDGKDNETNDGELELPGEMAGTGDDVEGENNNNVVATRLSPDKVQSSTFKDTADDLQTTDTDATASLAQEPEDLFQDETDNQYTSIQATVGTILSSLTNIVEETPSAQESDGTTTPLLSLSFLTPFSGGVDKQSKIPETQESESQGSTSDFIMPSQFQCTSTPKKHTFGIVGDGCLGNFQMSIHVSQEIADLGSQNGIVVDEKALGRSDNQKKDAVVMEETLFSGCSPDFKLQDMTQIMNLIDDIVVSADKTQNTGLTEDFPTQSLVFVDGRLVKDHKNRCGTVSEKPSKEDNGSNGNGNQLATVQQPFGTAAMNSNNRSLLENQEVACSESENAVVPDIDEPQTLHTDKNAEEFDAVVPQTDSNISMDTTCTSEDFDFE